MPTEIPQPGDLVEIRVRARVVEQRSFAGKPGVIVELEELELSGRTWVAASEAKILGATPADSTEETPDA